MEHRETSRTPELQEFFAVYSSAFTSCISSSHVARVRTRAIYLHSYISWMFEVLKYLVKKDKRINELENSRFSPKTLRGWSFACTDIFTWLFFDQFRAKRSVTP